MAAQMIQQKVSSKKVMMFSKPGCPYCAMAKNVLKQYLSSGELSADEFEVMEIGGRSDCGEIQNELNKMTGARTVPRVFVKGKCIGGGSETEALHRNGQLKGMLTA